MTASDERADRQRGQMQRAVSKANDRLHGHGRSPGQFLARLTICPAQGRRTQMAMGGQVFELGSLSGVESLVNLARPAYDPGHGHILADACDHSR